MQKSKRKLGEMSFLTGNSFSSNQVKNIKDYKEPQRMKQNTPEMAQLKKVSKQKSNKRLIKRTGFGIQ